MIEKVISGGQVGADIAGLRAAKRVGIETGGWAPKGFLTKKGPQAGLLRSFNLIECAMPGYPVRTAQNVIDGDATIRFVFIRNSPGELCTLREIRRHNKPYFDISLFQGEFCWFFYPEPDRVADFLKEHDIRTLNIAGNAIEDIELDIEFYLWEVFWLTNG